MDFTVKCDGCGKTMLKMTLPAWASGFEAEMQTLLTIAIFCKTCAELIQATVDFKKGDEG